MDLSKVLNSHSILNSLTKCSLCSNVILYVFSLISNLHFPAALRIFPLSLPNEYIFHAWYCCLFCRISPLPSLSLIYITLRNNVSTMNLTFWFLDAFWLGFNCSWMWRQGGSLRWRVEGRVKGEPCTKVQVYAGYWAEIGLASGSLHPPLLSLSVPRPHWMALFVFLSNTQSPAD